MALTAATKDEDRALELARLLGRRMQAHAIVKLNNGVVPKISPEFLSKQVPLLTELMVVSNLRGRIDAKKHARRADLGLKLSEGPVFEKTIETMRRTLGPDLNLRELENKFNIVGLRTLTDVSDTIEKDIRKTAYDLIKRGATVKEAKQVLSERFDALGLTPKNSFQLETIFRTASAVAYGAGAWAAYQDKDVQEILWGYTYSAVMDDRTRPNHAAANGVTLPKDDDFWYSMWPPNGYNCRCEVIPLFNSKKKVQAPEEAHPDPGFGYNPGNILQPDAPPILPINLPESESEIAPTEEEKEKEKKVQLPIVTEPETIVEEKYPYTIPTHEQQLEWQQSTNIDKVNDEIQGYINAILEETGVELPLEIIRDASPISIQGLARTISLITGIHPKRV